MAKKSGSVEPEEELELAIFNPFKGSVERLPEDKLKRELKRIAMAARSFVGELSAVGDYKLKTMDLSVGASGNALIVAVNGGIALHFEKP